MNDGFLEFAEDNSTAGYRCKRIEIYNWGTFNSGVVTLSLDGRNSLLTGDIGSGKSTLVDAVTTLLVPSNKIAYNKAAGADFKERSLRSYVLGYYKSERSDGGFSAKPVALRESGTTHSVILGVFHNENFSQDVTLAQVFYQKDTTGQPQRFFVVADAELSIKADFSDFGKDLASLKRKLKTQDKIEVYDSFPEYGASFQRRFGLKNKQALDLFLQTVSLKTVGNLTSFVQEHMLEPFDSQTHIENLIHHFEDLNQAHESILKAKAQIQALKPLVENLDKYKQTSIEVQQKTECRDQLKYYFAGLKKGFLNEKITRDSRELNRLNQKIAAQKERIEQFGNDRDQIKQSISEQGGNRIEALQREITYLEKEKKRKQEKGLSYDNLANQLGFSPLHDIDSFSESLEKAIKEIETNTDTRDALEIRVTEQNYLVQNQRRVHQELLEELISLRSRKSNIDTRQIRIREMLCQDLHIREEELPFVGELIAVQSENATWEGSIERVLRSFALSLLVPEKLYKEVSEWVDSTHLNGRIIYYRMTPLRNVTPATTEPSSLVGKLLFKQEHPYATWVKYQVFDRFKDFICCEDLSELRNVKKGLTRAGQVKISGIHHEKDDRFEVNDRSRYILGWVNTAKIILLERQKIQKEEELQQIESILSNLQKNRRELETRIDSLKAFCLHNHFEELNWQPSANEIEEKKREIHLLEEESDVLKTLQSSLTSKERELAQEQEQLSLYQKSQGATETKLQESRQRIAVEEELLCTCMTPIQEIETSIGPLLTHYFGEPKLYYETCASTERDLREKLQAEIDNNKRRLEKLQTTIISAMEHFKHDYPSETREVDAAVEAGPEYASLLNNLEKENLPEFENKFKELLNENTIREIAAFQALLTNQNQKIKERVALINRSMHEIAYNPGRYIRLEAINTNDVEIKAFKNNLKECIEGSLSGSQNQQYSEHKFLLVKQLINRFKGREGFSDIDRKWTNKISDVRNWFAFAASERYVETDIEYEHYTDSGGKSGGQKEKLAYTVLAASLAYQFGLEYSEVRSRSFRFVVIDEAFGRGSDESARFGLELFKKLDLQLLIVTPLQKIHIIEPYVSSVGFVYNAEGKQSLLRSLTIQQYQVEKEKRNHIT